MKKAVFSFFPTCEYNHEGWWGYFPRTISGLLSEQGVTHRTSYWRYAEEHTPPDVQRHQVSVEALCSPGWVAKEVLPALRSYDQVIVHHHGFPIYTALWRCRYAMPGRSKWLMTDHFAVTSKSLDRWGWRRRLRRWMRRWAVLPDLLVCVSEANRSRIGALYGEEHTVAILNGVRIPKVPSPVGSSQVLRRALYAGRLVREKGIFVLLEAMRLAQMRKVSLDLTIMGMGPEQAAVQAFICEHQLENTVHFVGPQADPARYYLQSDFIVIPSIWAEPCPLVSMEAQAHYLPAIYTDRGGLPETQIRDRTGLMIPANDPAALLQAMLIFQQDPLRVQQMKKNARRNVEQHFTVDRMAADYVRLYARVFEQMTGG